MKKFLCLILLFILIFSPSLFKFKLTYALDFSLSITPSTSLTVHVKNPAIFRFRITNNCNQPNIYNVYLMNTLPQGWDIGYFHDLNGNVPLNDTNGDGFIDTGSVNNGTNKDFYVFITPKSSVCNNTEKLFTIRVQGTNQGCEDPNTNYIDTELKVTAINGGALIITKEVSPNEGRVGDIVTWTIHIKNSGSDPIGNVNILDTLGSGLSNPNNFTFNPQPSGGGFPNWVYNEIPPNSDYTLTFNTTISGCSNADNTVNGWWGVDENNKCQTQNVLQSVKIVPTTPSIQYVTPNIVVPYCGSTNIDILITNIGDGAAKNFKLKIDTIPQDYQISNIGANWSYDSNTGEFTYLGGTPQGTINSLQVVHLTFRVSMVNGSCNLPSITLIYSTEYYDPWKCFHRSISNSFNICYFWKTNSYNRKSRARSS